MTGEAGNVIHFTVNNGGINMTIGNPAIVFTVACGITQITEGTVYYRGTTAEMAAKKIELLALGTTAVIDWSNTDNGEIYRWNGSDWI